MSIIISSISCLIFFDRMDPTHYRINFVPCLCQFSCRKQTGTSIITVQKQYPFFRKAEHPSFHFLIRTIKSPPVMTLAVGFSFPYIDHNGSLFKHNTRHIPCMNRIKCHNNHHIKNRLQRILLCNLFFPLKTFLFISYAVFSAR